MTGKIKSAIADLMRRRLEIRQATAASPGMEVGAAYKIWKTARSESAEMLLSADQISLKKEMLSLIAQLRDRPCTRDGCAGLQRLETICSGCIEGRAGYKTKWTCRKCLHRDLSKETMDEWILKLSTS